MCWAWRAGKNFDMIIIFGIHNFQNEYNKIDVNNRYLYHTSSGILRAGTTFDSEASHQAHLAPPGTDPGHPHHSGYQHHAFPPFTGLEKTML